MKKRLTKQNLKKEKNGSGIYKIYSPKGSLLYVGRASNGNVKHHLIQHFRSNSYSGAKFGKVREAHFYDIKRYPKSKVKKKEKTLIKRLKPKVNIYKTTRKRKNPKQ